MKRFLPALGFGVVVLSVAVMLPLYLAGQREKGDAWQPLPGGGEIRFHGITHGATHRIYYPQPEFGVLLQRAAQTHSLQPFFQKPDWSETTVGGSSENIAIWMAIRGRKGGLVSLAKSELTLPDGQIFYSGTSGISGSREFTLTHVLFHALPYTAKQLRFASTIEGKRFEWEIPNSTYREDVPQWTPEPLPQTREIGDFKVTMTDLKLEPSGPYTTQWRADPDCAVFSADGKDVGKWFSLGHTYSDAGGNKLYQCGLLSASAWKVTTRLSRTNAYPFKEEEVRWIGAMNRFTQEAFAAETYAVFPLDGLAQARGMVFAGLVGPGQYDIDKSGSVVRTGPPVQVDRQKVWPAEWLHEANIMRVSLEQPAFLILSSPGRGVSVFRDQSGRPVYLKEYWSTGGGTGLLRIYSFPTDTVIFGVAEVELASSSTQEVEFVVRPPSVPEKKAAAHGR